MLLKCLILILDLTNSSHLLIYTKGDILKNDNAAFSHTILFLGWSIPLKISSIVINAKWFKSNVLDTLLDVYCLSLCVFVLHRWQRGRMGEFGDVPKPCLVPPANERAVSPLYGVWTLPQKRKPKADPALTRFTSARHLLQSVYDTFYMCSIERITVYLAYNLQM